MYLLIYDGQICGQAETEESLPKGFSAVPYDGDLTPDRLELIDDKIREKQIQQIEAFEIPAELLGPNWAGLFDALHDSSAWRKVFAASTESLPANSAFTLLLNTLTVSHRIETLEFAIAQLREALKAIGKDFTKTELKSLNKFFKANSFDLNLE